MAKLKPYYPEEWKNNERMNVLFSPFRETRDINPHGWDDKLSFWKDMIREESVYSRSLIINPKTWPDRFKRKDATPVCLGKVIQELHSEGKVVKVSDLERRYTQGWLSWGMDWLVRKPLSWSWTKLFGASPVSEGEYVMLDLLQNCADAVLERHYSQVENELTDNTVELSVLRGQCSDLVADERTFHLVLLNLAYNKRLSIVNNNNETIIRFVRRDNNRTRKEAPKEVDLNIIKIKKTAKSLESKREELYAEMESCKQQARVALNKGQRNTAKSFLRKKKLLEKKLEMNLAAQDKLTDMLERIKETESNKMILEAYSAGASAYRGMVSTYNISPENIDKVMDDVNETLILDTDVSTAIGQGIGDVDSSTAELEDELNKILAQDRKPEDRKLDPTPEDRRAQAHSTPDRSKRQDLTTDDSIFDDIMQQLEKLPTVDDDFLPDVPTFDPSVASPVREGWLQPTPGLQLTGMEQGEMWAVNSATRPSPSTVVEYPSQSPIGFTPDFAIKRSPSGNARDQRSAREVSHSAH